jgi:hypothetical protein
LRYNQPKYRLDEARIERRRTAIVTDISSEPASTSAEYDQTPTQMDTILRFITDQTMGIVTEQPQRDILHRVNTIYAVPNDWHDNLENVRQGLQEGTLTDFDWGKIEADEQHYLQSGLEHALWENTAKLRFLGLPEARLREYLASYSELSDELREMLMNLYFKGMQSIMKPGWQSNGGVTFQQTKGYQNHRIICAHEFAARHNEGRLFVIRASKLSEENRHKLHISPLKIAENQGKKPRVCHHLSKSFALDKDNSYNQGIHMDNHRVEYPCNTLPTIQTLCTMMGRMRDAYPEI